jgi:hypothetical protein
MSNEAGKAMAEGNSFIMGIAGIGMSFILTLLGWIPLWAIFAVLVYAAILYTTKFFATGIAGMFAVGVFTSLGWIEPIAYFSAVILGILFLAVKIASKYTTGGTA